ncbi:MAG TPA: hypothetical protein VEL28_01965, partial [Candidatus Binatia bacterium]|nr:hypothetical protein [Candidatus Binatia bacterium]
MDAADPKAELETRDGEAVLNLQGDWSIKGDVPDAAAIAEQVRGASARRLSFASDDLGKWDSCLLIFLLGLERDLAGETDAKDDEEPKPQTPAIEIDKAGLPEGVRSLIALAEAVPEREGARGSQEKLGLVARIGKGASEAAAGAREMLAFVGQVTLAFFAWTRGRARFRYSDLFQFIQEAGVEA